MRQSTRTWCKALVLLVCLCVLTFSTLPGVPQSQAASKGTVYAVLIGVGKYKRFRNRRKRWTNLDYTRRDVQGLYRVLTGPGKVPRRNIKMLYDYRATRRNIIRTMNRWLRKAKAQDTVMIYFSGHGAAGSDGISYWMAHDTPRTSVALGISQFALDGILARLRTRRVVLLIDACQSGQGIKGARGGTGRKGVIDPTIYRSSGRVTIASSKQNEFSYESKKIRHGIFSYALMQALQGKADVDKDGVVDADETYRYLVKHVPKLAWTLERGRQHPVRSTISAGLFALSFPGTKQKPKPPKGNLKIESVPPGASVSVDGVDMGETPLTLQVTPGIRRIEVTKDGYRTWKRRIYAYRTRLRTKRIRLRRDPNQPKPQPTPRIEPRPQPRPQPILTGKRAGTVVSIKGLPGAKAVYIPKGSFTMGSPTSEKGRYTDEVQHRVTLSHGFWMMQTEVTQHQFQTIMKYNPSHFKKCGKNCPVETVDWHEAALFANKLSQKAGLGRGCFSCSGTGKNVTCRVRSHRTYSRCKGWKLPTEGQWEYAARAGTTTARYGNLNDIAWWGAYFGGNSRKSTNPVKGKRPNQWKLYDILGNVYEWTYNYYAKYSFGAVLNPVGPSTGSNRVVRGGSWGYNARVARAAGRDNYSPGYRYNYVGLRLLRDDLP